MDWKLIGYSISSVSVFLLGASAWPGVLEDLKIPLLAGGMATSIAGMLCRYISHLQDRKAIAYAQKLAAENSGPPDAR